MSRWSPSAVTASGAPSIIEGAGVDGLLLGLLGILMIGAAAAIRLISFFVCAVIAHLRARALHDIAFTVAFLALTGLATAYFT